MAFINYARLNMVYSDGPMKENIRRLADYDAFHCLLAGNAERAAAVKKRIPHLPKEFLTWLNVCDGGMLFDTAMLATKQHDAELDLTFATYSDYNNAEFRRERNLSDSCFIFAVAIHSDLFFFDMEKNDGNVYQWDVEENNIYAIWPTFDNWLTDQIDEAIELIADEKLTPLDIKLEAGGND